MGKANKILFKSLTLVMAAMLCVGAAGCFKKSEKQKEQDFIETLGGVSETFDGAVSTQSYATATEAAQAFVQQEVVGEQTATVVNTKSNGTLTPTQVDELNLPADVQEGIVSVEEMEVEYAADQTSYTNSSKQTKKVTVYVIKYPNDWKYYTPAPITGGTISKSYYDSVFDNEKYQNCTFTNNLHINANVMMVINVDVTFTQTVMHAENKVYLEQKATVKAVGQEESNYLALYLEEVGNTTECYIKTAEDGAWEEANLHQAGFNSLEELTPFYGSYLDYTYFTKTDYGFRMTDENAKQYVAETLSREEAIKEYLGDLNDLDMNMFVKYYVCGGVLSGIRQDASFALNVKVDSSAVKVKVTLENEAICTNYGTTVINRPQV